MPANRLIGRSIRVEDEDLRPAVGTGLSLRGARDDFDQPVAVQISRRQPAYLG